jgi:hypothetical protein
VPKSPKPTFRKNGGVGRYEMLLERPLLTGSKYRSRPIGDVGAFLID